MNNIIKRKWNQNSMVIIEDLQGMAFQAESGGHTFQISGIDGDGNPVTLSGTPSGTMLRPDNTDQTLTCSVSDGKVYATLPDECYDVPGRAGITIFLTSDSQTVAIYAAVVSVTRTQSGTAAPGTTADVVDLVNAINAAIAGIPATDTAIKAAMAPTYSNSSLYAVGSYAWYNGTLYRCTTAITTAETWTSGHWTAAALGNDLRDLKSAFEEFKGGESLFMFGIIPNSYPKADGTFEYYANWDRSDYIPVEGNQIIYIDNTNRTGDNAFYDANKQIISRFTVPVGNPAVITTPSTARFMVVSNQRSSFYSRIYTHQKYYASLNDLDIMTGERAEIEWAWGQISSTLHTRMHTEKISITQNSVLFVPTYIGDLNGILSFYDSNGTRISTPETASWNYFNTALPSELKYYVVTKSAVTMQIEVRKDDNTEITENEFYKISHAIAVIDIDEYSVINCFPKLKGIEKTLENYLLPVDTDTESETGKTDMRTAIMDKLQNTGYCKLAPGIYYVSGGIDMPAGSKLEGSGKDTIVRLLQNASYNYVVKARINNTIRDIRFSGAYTDIPKPSVPPNWPPEEGQTNSVRHGIVYGFGVPSQDARDSKYTVIDNCVCENFTGAGFYGYASGAIPYQGLSMTNSTFKNCTAGMDFAYGCEYNRITNCQSYDCYYGCINNCGNNQFINCTFDGQVGFIIDPSIKINNSDDDPVNLAHGSCIGCLFNHIGSGTGYAISMTSARNDFIIDGCQFWYSNIYLKYCRGIMITNCVFGGRTQSEGEWYYTHIVIESGNDASVDSEISKTIILSNCFFHFDPVFVLTGIMDNVKAINSYNDYSGEEIVIGN